MSALFRRWLTRLNRGGRPAAMAADVPLQGRRLMVLTEYFNATYYISFDAPLRALHERGEVSFRAYDQQAVADGGPGCWQAWFDAFKPDVVFLTRYGRSDGVDIVRDCHARGIPVIYHIDDNLLDLPSSLGAEILQRQGAAAQARALMMQQCDLIYASTAVLADVLKTRFPDQVVFHGIYAAAFEVPIPPKSPDAPLAIGYMGSKGHKEDLALVVPALVALMEERPQLRFETFGTIEMPAELRRFGDRVKHHTVQKTYHEFLRTLAGLGWSIGLAPLVNEPFNQCKAPTKFIEYTCCGIPVIASDVIVYRQAVAEGTGVLVCDSDWLGPLTTLLDDPARRFTLQQTARVHCHNLFSAMRLQDQLLEAVAQTHRTHLAHAGHL